MKRNDCKKIGMKAKYLCDLKAYGFNVPDFFIIADGEKEAALKDDWLFKAGMLGAEVAVRSSSVLEDNKDKSAAGQFKSVLNVKPEGLSEAVRQVRESAQCQSAPGYFDDEKSCGIGVIVQKMIKSCYSGTAFSNNPVTYNPNEILIEMHGGLGEDLVSGKIVPEKYIFDRTAGKFILSPDEERKAEVLKAVAVLASDVEKKFRKAVDIEWAYNENSLYILQARPITTLAGFSFEAKNKLAKKIRGLGKLELYAFRDFVWFPYYIHSLASRPLRQKKEYGFSAPIQNGVIINGHEYYPQTETQYSAGVFSRELNKDPEFFNKYAEAIIEKFKAVKEFALKMETADYRAADTLELIEEFERFTEVYISSYIPMVMRPDDFLTVRLTEYLTENGYDEKDKTEFFIGLAESVAGSDLLYENERKDFNKLYALKRDTREFNEAFQEFLVKYSWMKAPLGKKTVAFEPDEYIRRLDAPFPASTGKVNKEDILPAKDGLIQQYGGRLKKFIYLRTFTAENSDRLFYVFRTSLGAEIAKRTGVNRDDLLYFCPDEIIKLLQGKIPKNKRASIIAKRKTGACVIWENGVCAKIYGTEIPAVFAELFVNPVQSLKDGVITGSPVCYGKTEGIVKVVKSFDDCEKVNPGDVIVTSMLTPNITMCLNFASAFVTEEGGVTCHAAIIAREYNVPAIVGAANATHILKDGMRVRINAFAGTIEVIDKKR